MVTVHNQMDRWLADITTVKQLDHFQAMIWRGHADGQLDDDAASTLAEQASLRRLKLVKAREQRLPPARSYYPKRPATDNSRWDAARGSRCPVRWARKRRLGDMAALPPKVRDSFTEGERAVLYIIAADCRQNGVCTCSVKEIGDRAGISSTTVRNALRRARRMGLISTTERPQWRAKHLTNIVKILCPHWIAWLKKFRPNLGLKFHPTGFKKPMSTETVGNKRSSWQPSYNQADGLSGGLQPFAGRKPSPD